MPEKEHSAKDSDIEAARRIMKRLTEMPHRDHAESKVGQKPKPKATKTRRGDSTTA